MALSDNLVAYLKFDNQTANDYTTNGNNGTSTNVTYTTTNAKIGYSASFPSSGARYITVPSSASLSPTSAISIALWMKWSGNNDVIISKYNGVNYPFELKRDGSNSRIYNINIGGTILSTSQLDFYPSDGAWHYVVCTYDGTNLKIYVNGSEKGTVGKTGAIPTNSEQVKIGDNRNNYGNYRGLMDEIAIWSRGLSSSEVTTLYNGGSGYEIPIVIGPSIDTTSATDVTNSSCTLNGDLISEGSQPVIQRGFVWDTVSHSDPGDVAPDDSDYSSNNVDDGDFETGAYSYALSGLELGTNYYFRAYANNTDKKAYGDEVLVTTLDTPNELRNFTNRPGLTYDITKTQILYAQDLALIKQWIEYFNSKL